MNPSPRFLVRCPECAARGLERRFIKPNGFVEHVFANHPDSDAARDLEREASGYDEIAEYRLREKERGK